MLAAYTFNLTATHAAIAGGILSLVVGFFVVRRIVRAIKSYAAKAKVRRDVRRTVAKEKREAQIAQERVEAKAKKEQERESRRTLLPGLWGKLYDDAVKCSFHALKTKLIERFALDHKPSDLPRLDIDGARLFCKLVRDGDNSVEDLRTISAALVPFMGDAGGSELVGRDKTHRKIYINDRVRFGRCTYSVLEVGENNVLYVEPAKNAICTNGWSLANNTIKGNWCRKVVGGDEKILGPTIDESDVMGCGVTRLRASAGKIEKYPNFVEPRPMPRPKLDADAVAKAINTILGKEDENGPFNQ